MYPILLQLGPITIFSLWVMVGIGFFTALLILNKLVKKARLKLSFLADHSLSIFLGGLVLSRIFFVVRNYEIFFTDLSLNSILQVFYIWDKGLSVWGAILGILLSVVYFAKKENETIERWIDVVCVSILGAMSFSHLGAFLDGRHYGNETALPWGVIIENSIFAVPIHPVQVYAAIYTGILTVVLMKLFNHRIGKIDGNISIIALTAYSACRFLEEFLRGDESNIFIGMREAQIYALLGVIIGGILLFVRHKKKKTANQPNPNPS
ncbi:prolipoprotein diacylglyceryl transferase [Candidatus Peregrinibacteria bacterium]|nr:prolipoprotein diacylglyceryl transferase [Candidatus Peregrinibacteria bacterium]